MSLTVSIIGADKIKATVLALARSVPAESARILNGIAEETMTDSKERTPVKHGTLRRSGKVSEPATARRLETKLTYGTEYALAVHEIPPPPQKSEGGRSARHKVGGWKFLEHAMQSTARWMPQRLQNELAMTLRKRAGF